MSIIQVKDKFFEKFISTTEIDSAVQKVAEAINRDYETKNPIFLAMLNGAFIFASDLIRKITVPCEISFVKFSSYSGTTSTEKLNELIGLNEELKNRYVIVLEDIVDTGITMNKLLKDIWEKEPLDVKVACFCFKPDAFKHFFTIDYLGMSIPNEFILGYGLDYDGQGRNLPDIYKIVP